MKKVTLKIVNESNTDGIEVLLQLNHPVSILRTLIKVLEYLVYIALMIFLLINNSTFILGTLLV